MKEKENIGKTCTFKYHVYEPAVGYRVDTGKEYTGIIKDWQPLPFQNYVVKVDGFAMPFYVWTSDVVRITD